MSRNRRNERQKVLDEYQRLSVEHEQIQEQARRWGTTMRDLGDGLLERPHRVFVMMPEGYVVKSGDDIVFPTSDLPTLPQIHQLAEKIRRTRTRLQELKNVLSTLDD